jgi:hypothetical protein
MRARSTTAGTLFSLSKERFYLIGCETEAGESQGGIWIAVMEGEPLPTRTYNHVAFKIAEAPPCTR